MNLLSSIPMDVFVIPLGGDRYELYCETALETEAPAEAPARGIAARVGQRFSQMLKTIEQRHRHPDQPREPQGWFGRLQDRALAWAAERMAEQRLLWRLRGQT